MKMLQDRFRKQWRLLLSGLTLAISGLITTVALAQQGGFFIRIVIDDFLETSVASISGISSSSEIEESQASDSATKPLKRPGRTKYGNIVLKRGIDENTKLWEWRKKVVDGPIEEARKDGAVIIFDSIGRETARIQFFDAWPARWSLIHVKGEQTDQVFEEVELAVERIERIK